MTDGHDFARYERPRYSEAVNSRSPIPQKNVTPPAAPSFEELAAEQGVQPVSEFADLLGERRSDDESVEEFAVLLRSWRTEGTGASSKR